MTVPLAIPAPGPDARGPDAQAQRLEAVRRYQALDAPADGAFDRIADIAAMIFQTPIATVSIVDENRVWFAATRGLDGVTEVGVEPGLCASAVFHEGPYIVNDAGADARTINHPLVRGELGLRFYVAAPIVTADGHALGTVTAIDRVPRQVTETQTALLMHLAATVAELLHTKLSALQAIQSERRLLGEEAERLQAAAERTAQLSDAATRHRGVPRPAHCQLGGPVPCRQPAELKVADSCGESAWGCFTHAEEALLTVSSVYLADESDTGLAAYRNRRTLPPLPARSTPESTPQAT
jgi:hypothetical protein